MQIPILRGVYTDEAPDYRIAYPRNRVPVPKAQGISGGYLRPGDGVVEFATGPGTDRGGINWNGVCYRVMGSKLVSVASDGTITEIGDVGFGAGLQASLTYSFDRLAIESANNLFYYDGTTLSQVVDPDLGSVIDVIWIDGFFMTTDGEFLVVTELNDPFAVSPTKYGSSEIDPDPIVALKKLRNEVYAINRYSIEVFDNVGGTGFPFQRIDGAELQRGCVGKRACDIFLEAIAFVGGALRESPAVWLGAGGQTQKLSDQEIDKILKGYTEAELALIQVEARLDEGQNQLFIHLPDQTLVYDAAASQVMGAPVWFTLDSGVLTKSRYRAFNMVWCYEQWICGDPTTNKLGVLDDTLSSHYGSDVTWEFSTMFLYNEGNGAIFHELELIATPGRIALGDNPTITTCYSVDGTTWSEEKTINAGVQGSRQKRLTWFKQGHMENTRIQRFHGTSQAHIAFSRLEARIEGLVF